MPQTCPLHPELPYRGAGRSCVSDASNAWAQNLLHTTLFESGCRPRQSSPALRSVEANPKTRTDLCSCKRTQSVFSRVQSPPKCNKHARSFGCCCYCCCLLRLGGGGCGGGGGGGAAGAAACVVDTDGNVELTCLEVQGALGWWWLRAGPLVVGSPCVWGVPRRRGVRLACRRSLCSLASFFL